MKYNEKTFNKEVDYYIGKLKGKVKGKTFFVIIDITHQKAFFSIAPLSRAAHELGADLHVVVIDGKSENLEVIKDVWYVYDDLKKGLMTKKVKALKSFITAVNKRTKTKDFEEIFKRPDFILIAQQNNFSGTIELECKYRWHRRYRLKELLETAKKIWKEGYNLKKNEKVSIGFVLTPSKKNTELPLEDYLDCYSLSLAMAISAKGFKADVSLAASTDRFSQLIKAVRKAQTH